MAFTYDLTNAVGKVRLLISDSNEPNHIFEDAEIQAFLDIEAGGIMFAAAMALEAIAGNEILVLKRIKTLDLETDGPAEAKELRALANSFRTRGQLLEDKLTEEDTTFEIAELVLTGSQWEDVVFGEAYWNA